MLQHRNIPHLKAFSLYSLTMADRDISLYMNNTERYRIMNKDRGEGNTPLSFNIPQHEGLLNIFFTGVLLRKRARGFFARHGITEVQFNVLALIHDQAGWDGELTQVELSRLLLVNRSNITSLIDRMEQGGVVTRAPDPDDRRSKVVRLTPKGRKRLLAVEGLYCAEVKRIMKGLTAEEMRMLNVMLGKIREKL
jgi:DNA-binding MarR family transcriptional regulator